MTRHRNRPNDMGQTKDEKATDGRGKHPSDGLAGKIQATQTTAPEGANWRDVLNVAWVAFEGGLDPADVWARKHNHELDEWGGAE